MVQNNYLVPAIFLPFILYLNIEVMGRWQTRFKGNWAIRVNKSFKPI